MIERSARNIALGLMALALPWGCAGNIGADGTGGPAPAPGTTQPGKGPGKTPGLGPSDEVPGGAGGTSGTAAACQSTPMPRRVWKLTASQYSNTIRALIPAVTDAGRELRKTLPAADGAFLNQADRQDMSPPHFDQLFATTSDLAQRAMTAPGTLHPCLATKLEDAACVRSFVESFGAAAFRRPMAADEVQRYVAFFDKEAAAQGRTGALSHLVRAFLLSPSFLYRTELGGAPVKGRIELTMHERASALSYFIADGPPDAELAQAATRGELATAAQIGAHARRLLGSPATGAGLVNFLGELVSADAIVGREKKVGLFADWKPELTGDLAREPLAFAEQALWREKGGFGALFSADYSVLTKRLATLYGAPAPATDWQKVALPKGQRSGLLTQGFLMAGLAGETDSDPVLRGKFVRERFLCETVPPPPPEVNTVPPKADGMSTGRERLERHSSDPSCAVCHRAMDLIGLTFERYDAAGRWRTTEGGKTIDTKGAIVRGQGDIPLTDATDLGRAMTTLPEAHACFVAKLDAYASGGEGDDCRVKRLRARFEESGGDVFDAVVGIVTSQDFLVRAN